LSSECSEKAIGSGFDDGPDLGEFGLGGGDLAFAGHHLGPEIQRELGEDLEHLSLFESQGGAINPR
jgi:hypothetical protein